MSLALSKLTASFSCHQLASSAPQLPCSTLKATPKRLVATKHSVDDADGSFNGTVDLYGAHTPTPLYDDDFQADDYARPKRNSSAVNAAVYECVRIHTDGRMATVYLKRRDLLRLFALDPRDLRCIDPNLHYTRLSPSLYVRGNVILAQLAGVRLIITGNTALLLDPHSTAARKLLGQLVPKLQVVAGHRLMAESIRPQRDDNASEVGAPDDLPFELDVLEAALHISISKLDGELLHTQDLVQTCLHRLPRDITPSNLDELRKVKSALVELESKSDAFREVLEGMMDDEDELKDFNLSSRVVREERRRQRERSRLQRELERERTRRGSSGGSRDRDSESSRDRDSKTSSRDRDTGAGRDSAADYRGGQGGAASEGEGPTGSNNIKGGFAGDSARETSSRGGSEGSAYPGSGYGNWEKSIKAQAEDDALSSVPETQGDTAGEQGVGGVPDAPSGVDGNGNVDGREGGRIVDFSDSAEDWRSGNGDSGKSRSSRNWDWRQEQSSRSGMPLRQGLGAESASSILNRIEASQAYDGSDSSEETETLAMQELRAMFDQEEEEQDLQEVEDLFEFYLQRATSIQTESERMLASARDLEESIGLTLSARRFEVQRLELRLSIGSFAAAIGAVLAGIFGMNLRSTLEESIFGFWGTTALIIFGCVGIYLYVLQWTRRRKILG